MPLPQSNAKSLRAAEFLAWLNFERTPERLSSLGPEDIDGFLRRLSKRLGRVAMQKPVATLRNLLRFLAAGGVLSPGLDSQIDTPRIYRQEQLPRALSWPTVQAFLQSINRDSAKGKRDYAIFTLMATYGLRACDIVALTLSRYPLAGRPHPALPEQNGAAPGTATH